MTKDRGARRWGRVASWLLAVVTAGLVLLLSVVGLAPVPALGSVLNPGTGIWRASPTTTAESRTLRLPGMEGPGSVRFESNGLAHIRSADDVDAFRLLGYTHATFRFSQMDLMRRQGRGELAEILGRPALESDRFSRDLGLRRAAERDWADMDPSSEARNVLEAYAAGVNAALAEAVEDHRLPTAMKMMGNAEPRPWTPVDSLVIQRVVTQTIDFNDYALVFGYARKALPKAVFDDWFPAVPKNAQKPFDTGPYVKAPLESLEVQTFPGAPAPRVHQAADTSKRDDAPTEPASALAPLSRQSLLDAANAVPDSAVALLNHSNAWVVDGSRTVSGKPLMAADPHLEYTLPPIWYQAEVESDDLHFSGATIPGIPVPLAGKTENFSWGVTAAQRPTNLFYSEKTDRSRPGQYYWKGAWHDLTTVREKIRVRGGDTETHLVRLTAHGPLVHTQGQDVSMWWGGTLPSDNVASVLEMLRAQDPQSFRSSLDGWRTPAVNFSYADRSGNIAMYNVGIAPQVPGHDISLPLPGTGEADVAGTIANRALPASVNPASGLLFSSNQREAGADYPYQYSSSYNYPNPGWQPDQIDLMLRAKPKLDADDMAEMQADWHDDYARLLVPPLLRALEGEDLSPLEQGVVDDLRDWDYDSAPDSISAGFFEQYKNRVSWATFSPWWKHYGIKQNPVRSLLPWEPGAGSLATDTFRSDVVAWLASGEERWFNLPDGTRRTGADVLRQTFHEHVAELAKTRGQDLEDWRYGNNQKLRFPSLYQVDALQRGPFRWGGNPRSINASIGTKREPSGKPIANISTGGATWRLIVDWADPEGRGLSSLPGGQSEDPSSPWYDNGIAPWMKSEYWDMHEGDEVPSDIEWKVQ